MTDPSHSGRRYLAATGIKLAVLDGAGRIIGEPVRVPTPPPPVEPQKLIAAIDSTAGRLGAFDASRSAFPARCAAGGY